MFHLKENNTTIKTEITAGMTTFLTMAYIVIVNPVILGAAGVPFDQVFLATIIAAAIGTLWMALAANYPIAIAPGMGLNAYFTSMVLGSDGAIDYVTAFAAVFVAGLIFVILSLTSLRKVLIQAIPENLKHAITAGIGLFIAFIGMRLSGLIVANDANLVGLGDLTSPPVSLTLLGLLITVIFMSLNIHGGIFYGMIITGIVAFFTGQLKFNAGLMKLPSLPEGILIWNPLEALQLVIEFGLYGVVFSFLLVTLFDTTGTMIGVAKQAGLMKDNKMPRMRQALLADSIAATAGAMVGTSPTSAYVESSAGVAAGGRTGLTSLTVAILFIIAAFFGPLVGSLSSVAAITAPALIIVGSLMIGSVKQIEWEKFDEAFPAFLIVLAMPLTSSIATGIAFGFISYPLMKVFKGKGKSVHPILYIFAILFAIQLLIAPH
ncbi:Xanthine/uracil/thiamine/ascorbate permease family protein [Planococcus halocryophilus Or1]|uniref:Guanine permease n=1 Tax=Planococcus halocryophilus TaxID=1215089 RepID=A0A1C7DM52_9BACL|nr:NCS2 family permease [Planococcus halocryophilus]ANU12448.1 guanine permease [Planococcus halocryophilus]EMF48193.1 Xanthine/uracil/thiamine/ascorbate permease family protein [Planococcus halocryophilus Or1]